RGVCGGSETLPSFPCVGSSPLRPTPRPGMPEAERREVDAMLRGLGPKYQRQLSVSTSNALESFAILEKSNTPAGEVSQNLPQLLR
ncbi:unnamed protein product, partial [Ectocarpus sp. 12 AP-2014]